MAILITFAVVFLLKNKFLNYIIVTRIFIIIEFAFLSYLFSDFLINRLAKGVVLFSIIPFVLFCLYYFFTSSKLTKAFLPLIIECLFFLIVILYFFYEKLKEETNEPLSIKFTFWLSVAFLIYFSGNLLLFAYSQASSKDSNFNLNYTIIYSTITILKNILLSISILVKDDSADKLKNDNLYIDDDSFIFNS